MRILLLALVLAGCAPTTLRSDHNAGYADWRCSEPWGWVHIREDFTSDAMTFRHEICHLKQMRRVGCEEYARRMADPAFADAMEAEAVRASLQLEECDDE